MGTNANNGIPIAALAAEYNFMKDDTLEKGIAQTVLENISRIPALALQSDLAVTGKKVFFSPNKAQQKKDIPLADNRSLFLFVCDFNARSQQILESIPEVRKRGALAAVITPSRGFPGSEFCNYVIDTGVAGSGIGEMLLRDVVFQFLSVLYREKYMWIVREV